MILMYGHSQDSLLNPALLKYAHQAMRNLRLACCGGGRLRPHVRPEHHAETMEMLEAFGRATATDREHVEQYLRGVVSGATAVCMVCGVRLQLLLITPCAHLVCAMCIDQDTCGCDVCAQPFDVDDFQRLQPG